MGKERELKALAGLNGAELLTYAAIQLQGAQEALVTARDFRHLTTRVREDTDDILATLRLLHMLVTHMHRAQAQNETTD